MDESYIFFFFSNYFQTSQSNKIQSKKQFIPLLKNIYIDCTLRVFEIVIVVSKQNFYNWSFLHDDIVIIDENFILPGWGKRALPSYFHRNDVVGNNASRMFADTCTTSAKRAEEDALRRRQSSRKVSISSYRVQCKGLCKSSTLCFPRLLSFHFHETSIMPPQYIYNNFSWR